jgi:hypothetical protein
MVCAGNPQDDTCHSYNNVTNTWSLETSTLIAGRRTAAGVQLSDTEWWISGGTSGISGALSSTELYTVGLGFSSYENLPLDEANHVMIKINTSHVMMIGGRFLCGQSWLFNINTAMWTPLQNMTVMSRSNPFAGLATYPDGHQEVVVAGGGGQKSTEIFSFDSMSWRMGPNDLPRKLAKGTSVQYQNSFLAVSGYGDGLYFDKIYKFEPNNETWIELNETLSVARTWYTSFLVPHDYIQCN